MKKIHKKTIYTMAAIVIAVLILSFFSGSGVRIARAAAKAESEVVTAYESRNVWDDLQGVTIDGAGLNLALYDFDESKSPQIISFVEFCYSPFADKQSDFGLYVYVYNPRGYDFTKNESLNKIQLRYGGLTTASYVKYALRYINKSENAGYEGLFYKFGLELTDDQRAAMLDGLNSSERVYEVSGIELYSTGTNATEYKIANTYRYSGYAKGYGSENAEDDTLSCVSDGLDQTLTLDVHGATYCPAYNNGKNSYTRDMLHSVYFSIPNEVLKEYGGLSAVHATWLNAITAPIFVTGNEAVYKVMKDCVWNNYGVAVDYFNYILGANVQNVGDIISVFDYVYGNVGRIWSEGTIKEYSGKILPRLHYLFLAENGNAANYELSGEEIKKYMQDYTDYCMNGSLKYEPLVQDKYLSRLFDSVDKEYTDINITADDNYTLKSEKLTQSFWQKLFGLHGTVVESSETFRNIEAIHEVKKTDFKSDVTSTCNSLYIGESYYGDFKKFYDVAERNGETVYLFRYYQSEYVSREVGEYAIEKVLFQTTTKLVDRNAYLAQETINLDFDIIDVTCRKGEVSTIIAVISSPKDLISNVLPPIDYGESSDWWLYALALIGGSIVVLILGKIISKRIGVRAMAILGSFLCLIIAGTLRITAEIYMERFGWLSKLIMPLDITCYVMIAIFALFVLVEIFSALGSRRRDK